MSYTYGPNNGWARVRASDDQSGGAVSFLGNSRVGPWTCSRGHFRGTRQCDSRCSLENRQRCRVCGVTVVESQMPWHRHGPRYPRAGDVPEAAADSGRPPNW